VAHGIATPMKTAGVCVYGAVGREQLTRPNMSAGGTCLSSLTAAPTFPRTVPRTSTLQRQSRSSVADNGLVDCSTPATNYNQRQPSQSFIDGPRSQPTAASIARQTHKNAVTNDRSVLTFTYLLTPRGVVVTRVCGLNSQKKNIC